LYKLRKIEMQGFKSFADRTRLEFGAGTVAVVGPNGCGKSNFSDAISWVLGEQSARMLRGERMSDVIFNGTSARPATGMAEVSLTLIDAEKMEMATTAVRHHNRPGALPEGNPGTAADGEGKGNGLAAGGGGLGKTPHPTHPHAHTGEITITRRLFRSGESDYLLNGEVCRLRDIQDLFMGTGLGPESYAIIEQGRIGQLLSSKPSDRRLLIEEAAGISKFKSRKRLAEAKLEASRVNLSRINDILDEVNRQVNSLKRQAGKARRYGELREELRGRQKLTMASRLALLEDECGQFRAALQAAQEACNAAAHEVEELDRELKQRNQRHESLEEESRQLHAQVAEADLESERQRGRRQQALQQRENLEARSAEAVRDHEQLLGQISALERSAAASAEAAARVQEEYSEALQNVQRVQQAHTECGVHLAAAESAVEAGRRALQAAIGRAAELRNQVVKTDEIAASWERQLARTVAERTNAAEEQERLQLEVEALEQGARRERAAYASIGQEVENIAGSLEAARREQVEQRQRLEEMRREFAQAMARKQAIEESLARHAYSTDAVRRLLAGSGQQSDENFRPLGVLADFIEVAPGYEELVEEFLQPALDCVVVERHDEARSGIELLRREGAGRSTFFITRLDGHGMAHSNGKGGAAAESPASQPGVRAGLADLVQFDSRLGINGTPALPALANAFVVEDAAAAEKLAASYPDSHFITLQGEHYHHRMVTGGKVSSAGPLALRRDFRGLEKRAAALETALAASEDRAIEIASRVESLDRDLRELREARASTEKQSALADEKARQARANLGKASERLAQLDREAEHAGRERAALAERRASLAATLESEAAEQTRLEEETSGQIARSRELRSQLDALNQERVHRQGNLSALEERTRGAETTRARMAQAVAETGGRLKRLEGQLHNWTEERERLEQEALRAEEALQQVEAARAQAREKLAAIEQTAAEVRSQRNEMAALLDAARSGHDQLRERRSEIDISLARSDSNLAHHTTQCRDELGVTAEALRAEVAAEALLQDASLEAAEQEVREIKERIERLGPVNMMALEELKELEERYTFLETQRQDLLISINDTAQTIREIDQVSRRQFQEAYTAINAFFAETFRTLFGGGSGQMRLTDVDDPESGVDIVAQPPGKRLQNVLLLSGGEKALTALALLIAVFQYAPSPFCVLDEVDAPLDDSNVQRFTQMIRGMSERTQFILITHNKRTMEICSTLYGVTMEDPGVSKLVSVRFEAPEPKTLAVPA
jgi:chromosome segregation protein